jgi:hypothetical protein
MKWNLFLGVLFIFSVLMTFIYGGKSMIVYTKSSVENVPASGGGSTFEEGVTRTYQDNYASIGGAIGFAILGSASLLAFSMSIKKDRN